MKQNKSSIFNQTTYCFRRSISLGLIRNCVVFALSLIVGYAISALINSAMVPDMPVVLLYVGIIVAGLAIALPFNYFIRKLQCMANLGDQQAFREDLYRRVIARNIGIDTEGELDVKLTSDFQMISSFIMNTIPEAVGSFIMLVGSIIFIAITDYRIAIVFLLMNLLQLLPTVLYEKWAREAYDKIRSDEEAYKSWLVEGHRGMRTIKAYGMEKWFRAKFIKLNKQVYLSGKRAEQVGTVEYIVAESITSIITYGSYIVLGLFSLKWGLAFDKTPLLIILGGYLFSSTGVLHDMRVSWFSYDEARKRLKHMASQQASPSDDGSLISAVDIRKKYCDKTVLDGVSLSIMPSERVILIGNNGSGKSTLLRIMLDLVSPDSGTVTKKDGLVISDSLQQETALNQPGSDIVTALKQAGEIDIKQFNFAAEGLGVTRELLERRLSEYSGGELKKFHLAVAFAKPAELMILDEPTNHIDAESADFLIELIHSRNGAVLICSHDKRFGTINWDRQFTVRDGNLYG